MPSSWSRSPIKPGRFVGLLRQLPGTARKKPMPERSPVRPRRKSHEESKKNYLGLMGGKQSFVKSSYSGSCWPQLRTFSDSGMIFWGSLKPCCQALAFEAKTGCLESDLTRDFSVSIQVDQESDTHCQIKVWPYSWSMLGSGQVLLCHQTCS